MRENMELGQLASISADMKPCSRKNYLELIEGVSGFLFVKSVLKKVYFRIAGPLWRRFITHCNELSAAEQSSRNEIIADAQKLQLEVERLKQAAREQEAYIADLKENGLHELLSAYSVNKLRRPEAVVSALVDCVNGMELSAASQIHNIPADEINSWIELFARQTSMSGRFGRTSSYRTIHLDNPLESNEEIELLECQLEFNAKSSLDREQASHLQIARLTEELRLEKHQVGRVVNGQ